MLLITIIIMEEEAMHTKYNIQIVPSNIEIVVTSTDMNWTKTEIPELETTEMNLLIMDPEIILTEQILQEQ